MAVPAAPEGAGIGLDGRVPPQLQTDRGADDAGAFGKERQVETRAVPGHDQPRGQVRQQRVEIGEDPGLLSLEHVIAVVGGDCDRHDRRPGRVQAVDRGVGLDVESVQRHGTVRHGAEPFRGGVLGKDHETDRRERH